MKSSNLEQLALKGLIRKFTLRYTNASRILASAAGPFGVMVLTNIPVLSPSIFTSSMANPKPRSPYKTTLTA